jgi:hypothetical protein
MCSCFFETGKNSGAGIGADATGASLARQGAVAPDCTMSFAFKVRLDDSWANAGRAHIARIKHFNRVFMFTPAIPLTSCKDALRPHCLSVCYRTLCNRRSIGCIDDCHDRRERQYGRTVGAARNVLQRTETKA